MALLRERYMLYRHSITCATDALVCFVHFELLEGGYTCVCSGHEVRGSDEGSDWTRKELHMLKGFHVDDSYST